MLDIMARVLSFPYLSPDAVEGTSPPVWLAHASPAGDLTVLCCGWGALPDSAIFLA